MVKPTSKKTNELKAKPIYSQKVLTAMRTEGDIPRGAP